MGASDKKERAADEAADWFVRLQGEHMERSEREQFVEWLQETPLHVAEMLRLAQIHESIKHFPHWAQLSTGPKTDADNDNVVQFPPLAEAGSGNLPSSPAASRVSSSRTNGKRQVHALLALASMVVLVVGTIIVLPKIRGQVIETDRGERREVVLADGSVLQIDPQTRLRVKYADTLRQVFLERGRTLFHVAKNPNRPFLVQADDTTVRAVGTAFGVEQRSQGVIVTVAEGKVSVFSPARRESRGSGEPAGIAGSQASSKGVARTTEVHPAAANVRGQGVKVAGAGEVFLTANQQLLVQAGGTVEPVREVDSASVLAWAEGQLIFQNDELARVVGEFNRYNHVQLTITDPELARKPVSGVFNAAEPEAFIAFLQSVTPVEIVRNGDTTITISSVRSR